MANGPVRVASIGMGWWSDVLADAIKRSGKIEIASCFTRSEDKRRAFAEKYGCQASPSYEAILADPTIEAIINTTPNNVHLETTRAAAAARKHIFLDKPIANSVSEGFAISECARKAGVVLGPVLYLVPLSWNMVSTVGIGFERHGGPPNEGSPSSQPTPHHLIRRFLQ